MMGTIHIIGDNDNLSHPFHHRLLLCSLLLSALFSLNLLFSPLISSLLLYTGIA